jgi:pimeloyl-ACP methyl ester carboxylesterase
MQVVVDSLVTQYHQEGTGAVVVLLHGWGDNSAGLLGLRQALRTHYCVITPDLPGFGATNPPPTAWGLDEYATFVAHFLHKINASKPYAIIGHSNGGAIAIRGVAAGVLGTERVVLLASSGIRNTYKGRNRTLRILAKTAKLFTRPLPQAVQNKLRKKAYQTIGSDMLVVEGMQETFKKVVTDDVRADAAQLAMPVLLVYGENDTAAPLWYGQQFHELMVDSTLVVLPGATHFVHLDRPVDVARNIKEFLQ